MSEKYINLYCSWCGKYEELSKNEIGERICRDCSGSRSMKEHISRVLRERRLSARMAHVRKNHVSHLF